LHGKAFRLPSEAEWEFACRAGVPAAPCGRHTQAYESHICDLVRLQTSPVGKQAPNAFGLHDMTGIIEEWCSDWFAPYSGTEVVNPLGPRSSDARVVRGSKHPCSGTPPCSPCCRGSAREVLPYCSPCRAGVRLALDLRTVDAVCREELASDETARERRWHRLLELEDDVEGCRWAWTEEWCNVWNNGFSVRQCFQLSLSGRDSLFLEFSLRKDEESAAQYVRECRMLEDGKMQGGLWSPDIRLGDESWYLMSVTPARVGHVLLAIRHKRLVLHVRADQSNVDQPPTGPALDVSRKVIARYDAMEALRKRENSE
jgi:hypothetical protein